MSESLEKFNQKLDNVLLTFKEDMRILRHSERVKELLKRKGYSATEEDIKKIVVAYLKDFDRILELTALELKQLTIGICKDYLGGKFKC